jgi:CRP/FNR family nitrogen fixation transcriptional regulator
VKEYSRNESIFCAGEAAKYLYKIKSGCVRTHYTRKDGRRQIGSFYFPGDMFGLATRVEYSVTAEAVNSCRVYLIKRKAIVSSADKDNADLAFLLNASMLELKRKRAHIQLLLSSARERVASFLLEMDSLKDIQGGIDLPMIRQDIADYLGLTIETVSRTLAEFEKASAISIPSVRRVVVRDRTALKLFT